MYTIKDNFDSRMLYKELGFANGEIEESFEPSITYLICRFL